MKWKKRILFSIYNILINCLSLINEQRGTVYPFNSSLLFSSGRVINGTRGIFEIKDGEGFFILIELRPLIVFFYFLSLIYWCLFYHEGVLSLF